MKKINHILNCKNILIEFILKTNDNIKFFPIYDNKTKIKKIILNYKADQFYSILNFFNNNNYIGYFSRKSKLELIKMIIRGEDIKEFMDNWIEKNSFNQEIMDIENNALNLILEKMVIKGHHLYTLEDLEGIKKNFFISTNNMKNKICYFKTKIVCSKGIERDLMDTLLSITVNQHTLQIKDLVYIKNYYQDELEMFSIYNKKQMHI